MKSDLTLGPTARRERSAAAGFTLVELLVVIAIIAILAGFLFPALSNGKNKAQTAACLNNLKQLQLCFHMYADENDDLLPPNNAIDDITVGNPIDNGSSWCAGNARTDTTAINIEHGVLFQYNRSLAIYHCPADRSRIETSGGGPRTRSYSMSQSVNGFPEQYAAQLDEPIPSFKTLTQITDPSPTQLFVFLDVHEDEIGDSIFGIPTEGSPDYLGNWDDLPANRHNQGANFSFADGHVEHWRWSHPKVVTIAPGETGQPVAPGEQGDYLKVESGVRQNPK